MQAIVENKEQQSKRRGLSQLAPVTCTPEELEPYASQFEYVFDNDSIRNIALTGPNGSGKSSLMKGWIRQAEELSGEDGPKCITLSFAHFPSDAIGGGKPGSAPRGASKIEHQVEGVILSQLAQKVSDGDAPRSRIKITCDLDKRTIYRYSFAVALFALVISVLSVLSFSDYLSGLHPEWALVMRVVLACIASLIVFHAVRYNWVHRPLRGMVKRLKLAGGEIELFDKGDSVFDRHLDEVLYLFKASHADVVIFEDLDRFGMTQVFERLRGINDLLNSGEGDGSGERGGPIRFFYLMRDDLFEEEGRRKFFDYIIPVIPYVDPNSAFEPLKEKLSSEGIVCDRLFLAQLSAFVEDSRMLSDLVNESVCYRDRLFGVGSALDGEDARRLVSLMAYKVAYPSDFALLQVGEGEMQGLLDESALLLAGARSVIEELLRAPEAARPQGPDAGDMRADRDRLLADSAALGRERLEIASEYDPDGFEKLRRNSAGGKHGKLKSFLLMNGHIDESYPHYISARDKGSLDAEDEAFWMAALQGAAPQHELRLKSPGTVLAKISESQYGSASFRNYSLLAEMLATNTKAADAMLSRASATGYEEFVYGFILSDCYNAGVHRILRAHFQGYRTRFLGSGGYGVEDRRAIAQCILCDGADGISKDEANALRRFAEGDAGFLSMGEGVDAQGLCSGLEAIEYKLNAVPKGYHPQVLSRIFANRMFAVKAELLELFLTTQRAYSEEGIARRGLLTCLEDDFDMRELVDEQLPEILEELLDSGKNPGFSDDAIAWVLDHDGVDDDLAGRYAKALAAGGYLEDLAVVVNKARWTLLVEGDLIEPTEQNVLRYYSQFGFDKALVDFLNKHGMWFAYSAQQVGEFFDQEGLGADTNSFVVELIKLDNMDRSVYRSMLEELDCELKVLDLKSLQDWQIEILIDVGALKASKPNILALRNVDPSQEFEMALFTKDPDKYLSVVGAGRSDLAPVDEGLALGILCSEEFDANVKLVLLGKLNVVSFLDAFDEPVRAEVLRNHFDESDVEKLNDIYKAASSDEVKSAVESRCVEHAADLIRRETALEFDLLCKVVEASSLADEVKLGLIYNSSESMSYSQFVEVFDRAGLKGFYWVLVLNGSERIPESDITRKMLDLLLERDYISSYTNLPKTREFRVNAKRSHPSG